MQAGTETFPAWYPATLLEDEARFEDFQAWMHQIHHGSCPQPCITSQGPIPAAIDDETTPANATSVESSGAPAGYELAGSDAMCTDEALTRWNQSIEVGENPRSRQDDVHSCAERCGTTPGCNGFVFWPASAQTRGLCRTYAACDELLCEGCHEYRGSHAYHRV